MEIILTKNFKGLGQKNDTVTVKPGYGRNYLIPQGFAMVANAVNQKIAAENIRQASHKTAKLKDEAQAIAAQLDALSVEITAKAGAQGKIFGSVTASQLADAIKTQGITIDRRDISFITPVKELGTHEATLTLHKEVSHTLQFKVIATS